MIAIGCLSVFSMDMNLQNDEKLNVARMGVLEYYIQQNYNSVSCKNVLLTCVTIY